MKAYLLQITSKTVLEQKTALFAKAAFIPDEETLNETFVMRLKYLWHSLSPVSFVIYSINDIDEDIKPFLLSLFAI